MHYIGGKPQFAQYKNEIQTFPKLIYRVNAIPTKILASFLCRKWQANLKINMEMPVSQDSQNNLEKEQSGKTHSFWFQNWAHSYNNQDSMIQV